MRRLLVFLLVALAAIAGAQYPKDGVKFLSQIALSGFSSNPSKGSGCSGYVSVSGREYVVMGLRNGTAIVDVTNPSAPVEIGHISGPNSTWHESVVAGNYAYAVTEAGGGMQIIDLSLADLGVVTLAATYTGINTVHTIQEHAGYLYLNGSNRNFAILDIADPVAPVEVARWTTKYVHDSVIVTHTSGPNAGKQIAYLCCGTNGLYILDVTNKSNLIDRGNISYISNGYCHSGALTPNKQFLFVNDELDERNASTEDCTTHVFDVSNLDAPVKVDEFVNPIGVIDHNSVLRNGFLTLAAYRAGIRIYDATNPFDLSENGYFDTYPTGQGYEFEGAWGTFVFPSGNTAIADINRGMFMVDPSEARNQGTPFLDVTYVKGVPQSGNMQSMRHSDGASLLLRWTEASESTEPAWVDLVLGCETTRLNPAFLDVSFVGRVLGVPFAKLTLKLKNWSTGQFVSIGSAKLNTSYQFPAFTNIATANYINTSGRIEVKAIIEILGTTDVPSFIAAIDQIKVHVRKQ